MKDKIIKYLSSSKHLWWTVTLLPGSYAIVYLYLKNFTVVNSWQQLLSFIVCFIIVPSIIFIILDLFFKRKYPKRRAQLYWSFLLINFSIIFSLSIYLGWRWKALILFGVLTIIASFFIAKHYKKIVLLLSLMLFIATIQLLIFIINTVLPSNDWISTPPFESYTFKRKPNIYLIQPDGFVGKPAAINSIYQIDNSSFYTSLEEDGFRFNHNFRSNYSSTLSSNSTLFTGQHHYLPTAASTGELMDARDIILGDNPVLRTLKKNGYHTNVVLEHSYLMLNYPDIVYDTNNVNNADLSPLLPDYYLNKDYQSDFEKQLSMNLESDQSQFYFVEILHPGHISYSKDGEVAIKREKNKYVEEVKKITPILQNMVELIKSRDPKGIIIIAADHGGFAGFTHTGQAYSAIINNTELKQSVFSSLFTVKAPEEFKPYQTHIKSTVAVFPMLFEYLSERPVLNKYDFDHSSYLFLKSQETEGLFRYFDSNGKPISEKIKRP
jgi:hypothetical protein